VRQDEAVTRVAAVDCGTNSIRLLVADVEDGRLTDVVRTMEVVRLGEGVDRTGRLQPAALARTVAATRRYAALCREHGVERVRFVATSASRDVENRDEFVAGVRAAIGTDPEVISGAEEAELSFQGALSVVRARHHAPYLVVDIGGGSTELAFGDEHVSDSISLDIGCVRLSERHLGHDPATAPEVHAAEADIRAALDAAADVIPVADARTLVGVAGSVTTVTAHALDLPAYDPVRIDGSVLEPEAVLVAAADLLQMPRAARSELPYMHPGRVDVIGAGALIWAQVVARVRAEVVRAGREVPPVVTSEHDILDGIALRLAAGRPALGAADDGLDPRSPAAVPGEERALGALAASGIEHRVVRHGRVGSLAEAARARGLDPSDVVKTIVVRRGDDDFVLVLVPGDRTIAWPRLRALLGVNRLSMPDARTALAATGFERGTITPFGCLRPWPVVADVRLADAPAVSIGGGAHGVSATVAGADLIRVLDAQVADVTDAEG
jgi:exopolyphosphatase/guanosine-5'-triphosphate,3'-diphosphate pyrophosphatase